MRVTTTAGDEDRRGGSNLRVFPSPLNGYYYCFYYCYFYIIIFSFLFVSFFVVFVFLCWFYDWLVCYLANTLIKTYHIMIIIIIFINN